MERTFLEGMVPATQYAGASHKTYPATYTPSHKASKSFAPSNARTILLDPEDRAMADRQTKYATLAPSEQKKQEQWAQSMIQRTGSCPEGFNWRRIGDGYQCDGGHHVISDELLAEGLGGVYALNLASRPDLRWGPYYAEPSNPKVFLYRGPEPRPMNVPPTVGNGSGLLSNRTRIVHGSELNASRMGGQSRSVSRDGITSQMGRASNLGTGLRFPHRSGYGGSAFRHRPSYHGSGRQGSHYGGSQHGSSQHGSSGYEGHSGI